MSKIADLVSRGVRVVVGDSGDGSQVPAEFFERAEPRGSLRSDISLDVEDFSAVYQEARVPEPFRGYGVDKMAEILESKRLASLPREVRVAAVMASLEAAGVPLTHVIKDAVLRDRALDEFVAAKEREVESLKARNEARVASLKEEIASFVGERNHEIDAMKRGAEGATSAFAQLQLKKRQEEERLRNVLAHFVPDGENPIPEPAKAK